jgi:hypothetical protein
MQRWPDSRTRSRNSGSTSVSRDRGRRVLSLQSRAAHGRLPCNVHLVRPLPRRRTPQGLSEQRGRPETYLASAGPAQMRPLKNSTTHFWGPTWPRDIDSNPLMIERPQLGLLYTIGLDHPWAGTCMVVPSYWICSYRITLLSRESHSILLRLTSLPIRVLL